MEEEGKPMAEVHNQLQPLCESVQDLIQISKDLLRKTRPVHVWPGSKGNDRDRMGFRTNLTF